MKKKHVIIICGCLCLFIGAVLIIPRLKQNKAEENAPKVKAAGTESYAAPAIADPKTLEEAKRISDLQGHAVMLYERICRSFTYNKDGSTNYPDDFGDAYIDSDNVHLVLCLKDPSKETIDRYKALAGSDADDYLIIREVRYSRNELQKIVDEVAKECIADGLTIYEWYVDVMTNGIHIGAAAKDVKTIRGIFAERYPEVPAEIVKSAPVTPL